MDASARRRLAALVVFAGLVCALSASAAAEEPQSALLVVRTEGQINEGSIELIREAAARGLNQGAGHDVMPLPDTLARLEKVAPEIVDCDETACLQRAGAALELPVGFVVGVTEEFESWTVDVTAWDLESGERLVHETGTCDICTGAEAAATVAGVAKRAASNVVLAAPGDSDASADQGTSGTDAQGTDGRDRTPSGTASTGGTAQGNVKVAIYADPADATIIIDGEPVAKGHFAGTLARGHHAVRIERAGYTTAIKEFDLAPEDGAMHISADLRPTEGAAPGPAVGRTGGWVDDFDYETFAWVFTGGGGVLTIGGAILLGLDGEPTCEGTALRECPEVFETSVGGAILLGVGVAAVTTGVTLFLWDELAGEPASTASDDDAVSFGVAPHIDRASTTTDGGVVWLRGTF